MFSCVAYQLSLFPALHFNFIRLSVDIISTPPSSLISLGSSEFSITLTMLSDINRTYSRRGLMSLTNIQIMVSHPSFVHIPLPPDQSVGISSEKETKPKVKTRRKRRDDDGPPANVLHSEIVPMLRQTGFISETLSSDATSWSGIARLPGRDDQWGTVFERSSAVKNTTGHFRTVSLKFVILPRLVFLI